MINLQKILESTIKKIIKNRSQRKAVETFSKFITTNGWPPHCYKPAYIKAIQLLIDGKLHTSLSDTMVDLLTMTTRTAVQLSDFQIVRLKEVQDIIKNGKNQICKHINLGIASFMHGGGFSPTVLAIPELICTDCGLNVTLHSHLKPKDMGLKISKDNMTKLTLWGAACLKSKDISVISASDINSNPIEVYEKSYKWNDTPFPVKITDHKKLESFSGK